MLIVVLLNFCGFQAHFLRVYFGYKPGLATCNFIFVEKAQKRFLDFSACLDRCSFHVSDNKYTQLTGKEIRGLLDA